MIERFLRKVRLNSFQETYIFIFYNQIEIITELFYFITKEVTAIHIFSKQYESILRVF